MEYFVDIDRFRIFPAIQQRPVGRPFGAQHDNEFMVWFERMKRDAARGGLKFLKPPDAAVRDLR